MTCLLKFIHSVKDEEIVANGCKCCRICLRTDEHLERVSNDEDHFVINSLIELLPKHHGSEFIMVEDSAAIRNYIKNEVMVRHVYPRNMGLLINAGLDT